MKNEKRSYQIISGKDFKSIKDYENLGFVLYTNGKYMRYLGDRRYFYIERHPINYGHILGIEYQISHIDSEYVSVPLKVVHLEGEVREIIEILTYNPGKLGKMLTGHSPETIVIGSGV